MQRTFLAQMDHLHDMLTWIQEQIEGRGFDTHALYQIQVASEEALVNIMEHGIGKEGGDLHIEIYLLSGGGVKIVVKDQGPPFNPLEKEEIDLSQPLEEREIGGLGIHFMRHCMDELHYDYEANTNILTLIKKQTTRSSQKK